MSKRKLDVLAQLRTTYCSAEALAAIEELAAAADECGVRLSMSMANTEDLMAHMRLCQALAQLGGHDD